MKGAVVFDTSYGNTKQIAETITKTLLESGMAIDTFYVKKANKLIGNDYDFIVLGSPTRFGTMSFAFKSFLGKFPGQDWTNKSFAAFDTETRANIEKQEGSAGEKIAEQLREKQMKQLLPVLKAVVSPNLHCRLEQGEIERAADFAVKLGATLKN